MRKKEWESIQFEFDKELLKDDLSVWLHILQGGNWIILVTHF